MLTECYLAARVIIILLPEYYFADRVLFTECYFVDRMLFCCQECYFADRVLLCCQSVTLLPQKQNYVWIHYNAKNLSRQREWHMNEPLSLNNIAGKTPLSNCLYYFLFEERFGHLARSLFRSNVVLKKRVTEWHFTTQNINRLLIEAKLL